MKYLKKLLIRLPLMYKIYLISKGWFLNVFVNENEQCIKLALIQQGYNLNEYLTDKDHLVQICAQEYCKEHDEYKYLINLLKI